MAHYFFKVLQLKQINDCFITYIYFKVGWIFQKVAKFISNSLLAYKKRPLADQNLLLNNLHNLPLSQPLLFIGHRTTINSMKRHKNTVYTIILLNAVLFQYILTFILHAMAIDQ